MTNRTESTSNPNHGRRRRGIVIAALVMGLIAVGNLIQGAQGILHATPGTGLYAVSIRNLALGAGMAFLIYQVVGRRSILSLFTAALLVVGTGIYDVFIERPDPQVYPVYNGVSLLYYVLAGEMVIRLLLALLVLGGLPALRTQTAAPSE